MWITVDFILVLIIKVSRKHLFILNHFRMLMLNLIIIMQNLSIDDGFVVVWVIILLLTLLTFSRDLRSKNQILYYPRMLFNISILLCLFSSINSLFFSQWFSKNTVTAIDAASNQYPIYCEENLMNNKAHGTCTNSVMKKLRWNCNFDTADRICCFNRSLFIF